MTYGYEQLSLVGHARVLKVAAYGRLVGAKGKGHKTKLCQDKNKDGRDKFSLTSNSCHKTKFKNKHEHKIVHLGAPP